MKSLSMTSLVIIFGPMWMTSAFGFEDTKVLPTGVRKLSLRVVSSSFSKKTNGQGVREELERPLENELKFKDILKAEKDLQKRELAAGFLANERFDEGTNVGQFKSDLVGSANVNALIAAWGLTESVTLALAVPYYSIKLSNRMSFVPNETGQNFLNRLSQPANNNTNSAREAGEKINNAVQRLNQKLVDNGYKPLNSWSSSGVGDVQLVGKSRIVDAGQFGVAAVSGVVIPTGNKDDPDNLIDKGFGDGQWDLLSGFVLDEKLLGGVTLSQHAKYIFQIPDTKKVRMIDEDEKIEVEKKLVNYKLGDKVEAGIGSYLALDSGFGLGAGYNFYHKFKDKYAAGSSTYSLEKNTTEQSHNLEAEVGYSTIEAFRRKEFAVPLETKLAFKKQIRSRNLVVSDQIQWDVGVFF